MRNDVDRRQVLAMLIAGAATYRARAAFGQTATITPTPAATMTPVPAVLEKGLLINMVSDLVRNEVLRDEFASDPVPLFEKYGLATNVEAMTKLYTMDPKIISAYLKTETDAWATAFASYMVTDSIRYEDPVLDSTPNCDQDLNIHYPNVAPKIAKVRWKAEAAAADTVKLTVTVFGQSFPREVDPNNAQLGIQLVLVDGATEVPFNDPSVFGTFRNSQMKAVFPSVDKRKWGVQIRVTKANPVITINNWKCTIDLA